MQYYSTRVPCHVASDMNAMGYNYDIMNIVTIIKKKNQRK